MAVIVKNCKLPSPSSILATGRQLTPVTFAKAATLYRHRDEVWAVQALASQAVANALSEVEAFDASEMERKASEEASPEA